MFSLRYDSAFEINPMTKDESKFRSSVRISMHEYFLEIALASYEVYQKLFDNLKLHKDKGGFLHEEGGAQQFFYHEHSKVFQYEQEITVEIIKAVVFLNMYCEAYIWDLGASVLGDSYAKKHLDKLDTLSKWVVIPRLLFGKSIDPGHHGLGSLKELIKWRNDFVHSKSKDGINLLRAPENYPKELVPLEEQIFLKAIFEGIRDLFIELDKTDPGNSHYLNMKRGI